MWWECYILQYRHVQDGICFACWGIGNSGFDTLHPQLNTSLKNLIENEIHLSNQKVLAEEIASLSKDYNDYDSELKVAEREEDLDDMRYYDIKMNEIITKLYTLAKFGKVSPR